MPSVCSTIWTRANVKAPRKLDEWWRDRELDKALRLVYEQEVGPVRNRYVSGIAQEQWSYNPRSPRFRGRAAKLGAPQKFSAMREP